MKILILILSLVLVAAPCLAGDLPVRGEYLVAAAEKDKKDHGQGDRGGRVVIKGKGGKVTDVKKPKKPKKHK